MAASERLPAGKVFFIGAGPGAPDLITVRGKAIIERSACIIYAGSLVNKALFEGCSARIHDSSVLNLDEIIEIIETSVRKGETVARVHTGDPCLYGATMEQMTRLDKLGISYEVVPGVTSAFGAAASLGSELTLPEVTQTVILTRRGGRTPVPEKEQLDYLASHQATMMIFLSVGMIKDVVNDLLKGGYPPDTPVAVVQRATWPDEKVVRGCLADISDTVTRAGISKTALICVGHVFGKDPLIADSKLYDKYFSHGTRQGIAKTK